MMEKIVANKWLKIGFFSLAGLLLAGGLVWAGIWWKKTQISEFPTLEPAPTSGEEQAYPALMPKEVTENFYTWYLKCLDEHFRNAMKGIETGKSPREDCPWEKNEYVSDELIKKVENIVVYDPILCAQDTPNDFTFGKVEIGRDQAIVIFTEEWSGPPQYLANIKVELRLINNQWKITNITCPIP